MHKHLEEYLVKEYPKIFVDYGGDPKKTCMSWGMSCEDGWFFLLNSLCQSIQSYVDNPPYVYKKTLRVYALRTWNWVVDKILSNPYPYQVYKDMTEPSVIPQVVALQVKEKFGGLRFYYNGGDPFIRGRVSFAESLSQQVCETCGTMDEFVCSNGHGWIRTSCSKCAHDKESYLESHNEELVKLWKHVKKEKENDRREETLQRKSSCEK
jgi:hypothetical protein